MKNIVYILTSVVLLGCSLTSCNEEILPEKENPTVNTADVPEGYMRVSFVPGDDVQTRGAVNDWVTTIYRVEALLYHDGEIMKFSDSEDGKVLLQTDEGNSVKWPYTQNSYERTLKRGETYTIVYLGNIPEEKRTDIEKLSTAKIMAPDGNWNEWFNSNNMYYFFSKEFTVPTDEEQKTMTIDVMLRRLVSRHIIGGFGIPEGCDSGEGSYEDRYYESFLNENHPLGLGKKMFSGVESVMGKQFVRRLTMDFIS